MKRARLVVSLAALAAIVAGVGIVVKSRLDARAKVPGTNGAKTTIQKSWMDSSADPRKNPKNVDFNRFANGNWIDNTNVPAEAARWGSFNVLRDNTLKTEKALLEQLAARHDLKPGSNEQKIADFWSTAMDEQRINAQGWQPLAAELKRIDAIGKTDDIAQEVAHLHMYGVPVLFGFGSGADFKDSSRVIAHAVQSGLGLPDRDFYLKTDSKSVALREKYTALVARLFELTGENAKDAADHARSVLAIETALAKNAMTRVDQRNPENLQHMMTDAEFQKLVPNFAVGVYFKALGAPAFSRLNVAQPEFFRGLNHLLGNVDTAQLKSYLRWHLIRSTASCLSSDFVNANFDFYGKTLQGSTALEPRWKRIVGATDGALGEAVGQLYVQKVFPAQSKAKVKALVENIRAQLKETIEHVTWMSEPTRRNALDKLNAFEAKIGYPDKWQDYSALTIDRQSYLGNVLRSREFASRLDLAKIGKQVDRGEWEMLPQTVNAYYTPTLNQIVFPAAILQAPFYDPNADDAVNYGGIGVVIGHEMTHAFDDQGSQFDAKGNVRSWWTDADRKNFEQRIALIIEEYDAFTVAGGEHVNGHLVAGEAAADLGGVKLAYKALQNVLKGKVRQNDVYGFTEEQRFFIAFAQIWAQKARPQAEGLLVVTDPHPPARYRVNGTLANLPEFAQAFGLKLTSPIMLPPSKRCELW